MKKKDLGFIAYEAADDALMYFPIWFLAGGLTSVVAVGTIKTLIWKQYFEGSVLSFADMKAQWLASLSVGETALFFFSIIFGAILILVVCVALFYGMFWLGLFIHKLFSKN